MQDNQLSWKQRFARMKKHYGFSYKDMAELLGVQANSIRSNVTKSGDDKFPKAWGLAVIVFEMENGLIEKKSL